MADDDGSNLTLVSDRSEEDVERDEALRDIEWPTREFVSNLFRVIRGAGKPYNLTSQLFELANAMANSMKLAGAWETNQAFERVISSALPDWEWDDEMRGGLHIAMRGALQLMASTLVFQSTHKVAGKHEMCDGINHIINRREERRKQREEEYRAAVRSQRPAPKKRKPAKRKIVAKAPPAAPKPQPPMPESVPEPKPRTTLEIMKANRQRLAEGKEPI